MSRNFKVLISFILVLFFVCGCDNKTESLDSKQLDELKELIEINNEAIKKLSDKNTELENKVTLLEEENKKLKETVTNTDNKVISLEDSDKNINSTIKTNYDELKKLIDNKLSSSNSYTISKSELLGTWNYIDYDSPITFTNDNVDVFNNWIIFKNNSGNYRTLFYMYRNGQLYITDDGGILKK